MKIRKITSGTYSLRIGQVFGALQIEEIILDNKLEAKYGRAVYKIYVSTPNSTELSLWKEFHGVDVVEYDVNY